MGAEDDPCSFRNLAQLFDEDGPGSPQFIHHVAVMNDFLADIDRGPIKVQCDFNHVDGAHHASAEPARFQQDDLFDTCLGLDFSSRYSCVLQRSRTKDDMGIFSIRVFVCFSSLVSGLSALSEAPPVGELRPRSVSSREPGMSTARNARVGVTLPFDDGETVEKTSAGTPGSDMRSPKLVDSDVSKRAGAERLTVPDQVGEWIHVVAGMSAAQATGVRQNPSR